MQFPVYFQLFGREVHPHVVMEGLAYVVGFGTHMAIRSRVKMPGGMRDLERGLWVIAGAILGALVGAKGLAWVENWRTVTAQTAAYGVEGLVGGKTIVGGLVGGWIGVEIAKKALGIRQRTGDTWVYPLVLSIAIGRVGCFLTGLSDDTYGTATSLPWGVDFGDGVPRHPTQLYEIGFVLLLGLGLLVYQRVARLGFGTGRLFRMFMLGYCAWRVAVEFIKPTDKRFAGLSAIQVVSLVTMCACVYSIWRIHHQDTKTPRPLRA